MTETNDTAETDRPRQPHCGEPGDHEKHLIYSRARGYEWCSGEALGRTTRPGGESSQ